MNVKIDSSWQKVLQEEFDKPYFSLLVEKVKQAYETQRVFPKGSLIFNAFNLCPFDKVKVVILGQDPYHEVGQAHGLAFSVLEGVPLPPSLQNIYKEIFDDTGHNSITNGNLTPWAKQGVLLLNSTLTVEQHKAGSHQSFGWETFTDNVISLLNEKKEHLVFILWGSFAIRKGKYIDKNKHLVLTSVHPSPLSAYRGFFCNKHFSLTNNYLSAFGKEPIIW